MEMSDDFTRKYGEKRLVGLEHWKLHTVPGKLICAETITSPAGTSSP